MILSLFPLKFLTPSELLEVFRLIPFSDFIELLQKSVLKESAVFSPHSSESTRPFFYESHHSHDWTDWHIWALYSRNDLTSAVLFDV